MNNLFLLLLMIFLHIVDDYYLQGWLASAKLKQYWEDNAPNELYKDDYKCALFMHSFSWSFMIMLPIAFIMTFNINVQFVMIFILNIILHAITDDLKANKKEINLIDDQSIHMIQIFLTFLSMTWWFKSYGNKHILKDAIKDKYGQYHDDIIYEIINN